MMYKCLGCGHLFEEGEQKTYRECVGEYFGTPAYEEYSGCPICEEAYEEIEPCKICGGYETKEVFEDVCEICKGEVLKRFRDLVENNFTSEERELLNELLDGDEI